ncbi:hypothetical protein THRCLA_05240 [Thraustotheca clavata]|uniref:Uncharacterized protein n=1 Tax=Thraustotheca clavata TaxID=74557 RepID=A0A1V9ZWI6_9STRA|nr:hypothetical protein THRCLA_05240 [Thraustotheca clavata]
MEYEPSTWLNKALICLRSVVAAVCLSTTPLLPTTNELTGYVHLSNTARLWYESAILAIECTWSIYQTAPWSCAIASVLLFSLDVMLPVQVVVKLDRSCYSVHVIFSIMITCVVGCVGYIYHKNRKKDKVPSAPSLVLPLALVSLQRNQNKCADKEENIDVVTAAMGELQETPQPSPNLPDLHLFGKNIQRPLLFVAGLVYLVLTLMGNVTYLHTAQAYLADDYGWANLNSTGAHVFLANLFNQQLLIKSKGELDIARSAFGDISQTYKGSSTTIVWSDNMARRR